MKLSTHFVSPTCCAALSIGGDAPETWLVLARALQAQSRFDEAEDAYRQALLRRPGYGDALRDLSQLVWMRDADLETGKAIWSSGHG